MVANFEVPGVFDVDRRLEHHALADFGTEEAKGEGFEARGGVEGVLEEECVGEVPEEAGYKAAAWRIPRVVKFREIDRHMKSFSYALQAVLFRCAKTTSSYTFNKSRATIRQVNLSCTR